LLKRYTAHGAQVFLTSREGAVLFESDGRRWHRMNWRTEE